VVTRAMSVLRCRRRLVMSGRERASWAVDGIGDDRLV
jgi:hypothetical protein